MKERPEPVGFGIPTGTATSPLRGSGLGIGRGSSGSPRTRWKAASAGSRSRTIDSIQLEALPLSNSPQRLQVSGSQTGMFGNPRHHARADFVIVVECEDIIRPTDSFQNLMRSARLTLDAPADLEKCSQDPPGFSRWPLTHGVTAKTPLIGGTGSPWSSRSARTRKARTCTRSIASWRVWP